MIKTVVKRNGEKEAFSAEKLNAWGEWAAKKISKDLDWSEVVLHVVATLPQEVSSKDIQQAAIDFCLSKRDWEHNLMAGRLYSPTLVKDIHGGSYPSVRQLHNQMQQDGLMVNLDYSDEEYSQVEKFIDHSLNLKAAHYSLHQNRFKYALRNKVTGKEYETQQFVYMRMAMALAEDEPKETRMQDVEKFYEHFSKKRINAPTPYLVNLGTNLDGYASCCVYTTGDSWPSLLAGDVIAYSMTCMSAGIGSHIKTRSLGDPVRSGLIQHQGKIPYYRALVGAINANLQNGRGGAATQHYTAFDPEVQVIQKLKNPMTPTAKQVRGIDYSFGSNKFFARKAATNEDIALFSYQDQPELYEAMYSKDSSLFEKLYNEYLNSPTKKTFVNAREIVQGALTEAFETGRHYLHQTDQLNKHTPFKDVIYSSNLCVAPETQILTDKGYFPISELEDQEVHVWNGYEFSKTTVRKTGTNQKLITVITNFGHELVCTPYHKFYTQPSYNGRVVEKRANELSEGDKLIKFDLPVIEGSEEFDNAYQNGFYTADGCLVKKQNRIYLYGEKKKLKHKFDSVINHWTYQEDSDRMIGHTNVLKHKFFVPSANYTIRSRLDWLEGYVDGDGTISRNGNNESLQFTSVELKFLREVQMMLQTLGVNSKINISADSGNRQLPANDGTGDSKNYWCRTAYRLLVSSNGLYKLSLLGFMPCRLVFKHRLPQRKAERFVSVKSVVDSGRVDNTYCFNEPNRHMGVFNGILTGQCQEVTLPTKGFNSVEELYKPYTEGAGEIALCNIAGIIPTNIESDDQYAEVAYYALKMIDKGIHKSSYVFKNLEDTAKARMNAGVGVVGLAHYMAKNKKKYSTQDGKNFIHELFETHAWHLYNASLKLGKEKGNAAWMNKTLWPEGWLPIDTYEKKVDELVTVENKRDWESLRKAIIQNGGIRNSVCVAHMPAESSSISSETTNGPYPIRDFDLVKTSDTMAVSYVVPDSTKLKGHYEIAWDIPSSDMVKCYAIMQKWTDQAISADLWKKLQGDEKVSSSEMLKTYFDIVKYGVKTRYYQNSLTAKGVDLNSSEQGCASGSCTL